MGASRGESRFGGRSAGLKIFCILRWSDPNFPAMTDPLALLLYKKLLPGTQLSQRLRDMGYRVQVAEREGDVLRSAAEFKPMVMVVDLGGAEDPFCDVIRRMGSDTSTSHIPIIAICKDQERLTEEKARKAGAKLVVPESAILSHLPQFLEQALSLD